MESRKWVGKESPMEFLGGEYQITSLIYDPADDPNYTVEIADEKQKIRKTAPSKVTPLAIKRS